MRGGMFKFPNRDRQIDWIGGFGFGCGELTGTDLTRRDEHVICNLTWMDQSFILSGPFFRLVEEEGKKERERSQAQFPHRHMGERGTLVLHPKKGKKKELFLRVIYHQFCSLVGGRFAWLYGGVSRKNYTSRLVGWLASDHARGGLTKLSFWAGRFTIWWKKKERRRKKGRKGRSQVQFPHRRIDTWEENVAGRQVGLGTKKEKKRKGRFFLCVIYHH